MREERIKLASQRRAVITYHCTHCGRTEYGIVISAHKKAMFQRRTVARLKPEGNGLA